MPYYEYVCKTCSSTRLESARATSLPCPECNQPMTRRFGFAFKPSMQEHWNYSTGQYVNNEREFKTALKRQSEEATIRTGIPHTFQPVDASTKSVIGATTSGLDRQAQVRHDQGIIIP